MSSVTAKLSGEKEKEPARKVKILLVDDTPENLVSLEAALENLGEELVFARSGKEALRCLLENNFATILLDVKMPDMDGFETAELIRSRPRSRHTPIIFLTGYKNEEHLFRGYDLGAVDFLFKPIVPGVLRSKVAVFVELSRKAEMLEHQATALVQQAAVLQRAEQTSRSLLEAAPDAMVICRENGKIMLVNSRTELLFNYRREELLDQHMRVLIPEWEVHPPIPSKNESPDGTAQEAGSSYELKGVRRDGSIFPAEITLSPIEIDNELLITSALRDITERKRIELERAKAEEKIRELNEYLAELNSHLEERVAERTAQLLRSNEELAQFAYVASHDLQEPLRTVSLYTQLLARRYGHTLENEGQAFVRYILDNAQRMEFLVRDLLEFCRVERQTERLSQISCETVLDRATANLQASIEESGAQIARDPLPEVYGDGIQLASVFQNLIANAIQYRKPGRPPEIHVSARMNGREWVFSVQDNGIGIASEYLEKVFGIFKRLHGRENPGTGMGLAICKKIVMRHGGRIWLESELGSGTTSYFTLPLESNP